MSLSAKGFITTVPGTSGRFVAAFSIDKIVYTASGTFSSSIPAFRSGYATLKYDYIGDLTSTRAFSGRVEGTNTSLTFDIGPTITGRLDMPIDAPCAVSGSVVWTQN